MKLLFIAVLMFGSVTSVSAQSTGDVHLWIPVDLKWSRIPGAPRNVHRRTAAATVLYFGKNGEFVRDECWLIRDGDSISISDGDPHNQYVGTKSEPGADGAEITYRLVRRTVERSGEVLPGPKTSEFASSKANSGLAMGGRFFRHARLANGSGYVQIYGALAKQYAHE
ncbi:MAG: hypothetical protein ACLPHP_00645 [Candidatus Sulfotelmatobacter sp.]